MFWCQDELLLKHFAASTKAKARRRAVVADVIIKTDIVIRLKIDETTNTSLNQSGPNSGF